MPAKKRKSVIIASEKKMLIKIPEHLLAEVQAVVKAKSKDSTVEAASDTEILEAATNRVRVRCRTILNELRNFLPRFNTLLDEFDSLKEMLSCSVNCKKKKTCVCGVASLREERYELRRIKRAIWAYLHPPREEDEDEDKCSELDDEDLPEDDDDDEADDDEDDDDEDDYDEDEDEDVPQFRR